MSTLPTQPPTTFEAGTTVSFTVAPCTTTLGEVSPDLNWTLQWLLRGVDEADVTATAASNLWTVTLSATASAALVAGQYTWALRATDDGVGAAQQVVTLSSGRVTVTPDVLGAAAGELQSWAEKTLAVLEASLAGDMSDSVQLYMIGDQQVQKYSLNDRLRLRDRLRAEVAQARGEFGTAIRPTAGFIR